MGNKSSRNLLEGQKYKNEADAGDQEKVPNEEKVPSDEGTGTLGQKLKAKVMKSSRFSKQEFREIEVLGQGAFGKVFLAVSGGGRMYAIKKMDKGRFFRRHDNSELAWNERNAMIACDNAHVIKLQKCLQTKSKLVMVSPLYGGGDLMHRLKDSGGKLEEAHGLFYLAECVLAIEHLSDMGFCHRDIKPDNIFLDDNGHAVLGDLGLSVLMDDSDKCHYWGRCGSPGYRAPEVVENGHCDFPADIYSLAITFYFLFHGGVPWSGTKVRLELEGRLGRSSLFFPDKSVDKDLQDLLTQMLVVDQTKRITVQGMKGHAAFKDIDWAKLAEFELKTPWMPPEKKVSVDQSQAKKAAKLAPESPKTLKAPITWEQNLKFTNFEYDENMANMGDALLKEAEKKDAAAAAAAAAADDDKPTEAPAADTA